MSSYLLTRFGERIELGPETLIGRSDECDLKILEGHPSRRHARLVLDVEGAWLEDLGSANGTFVNDQKITTRTRLATGDRIAFDIATFVYEQPQMSTDEATVVRGIPEDAGATVVRGIPTPPQGVPQAGPQGAPPGQPAPGPGRLGPMPRSWADPDYQNEQGTRMLQPDELQAMLSGAGAQAEIADDLEEPHLLVTSGDHAGMLLEFKPGQREWTVGTDAVRDLPITDKGVSAYHAKITRDGDRWKVIDQMSANGTFVNGQKGTVSYLRSGDKLRFGPVECLVKLPAKGRRRGRGRAQTGRRGGRGWLVGLVTALVTVAVLAAVFQFL